jgi:hypothetical protein
MAKMTNIELERLIERKIAKLIGPKLEAMVDEKLEEFSDDIASTINEVVEIKMKKLLKEFVNKKSLKDKLIEAAGGKNTTEASQINDQWSHLLEPTVGSTEKAISTGIAQDYIREARGVPVPSSVSIRENTVSTGIAQDFLNDAKNNQRQPHHTSDSGIDPTDIDALANADYPDDLLGE